MWNIHTFHLAFIFQCFQTKTAPKQCQTTDFRVSRANTSTPWLRISRGLHCSLAWLRSWIFHWAHWHNSHLLPALSKVSLLDSGSVFSYACHKFHVTEILTPSPVCHWFHVTEFTTRPVFVTCSMVRSIQHFKCLSQVPCYPWHIWFHVTLTLGQAFPRTQHYSLAWYDTALGASSHVFPVFSVYLIPFSAPGICLMTNHDIKDRNFGDAKFPNNLFPYLSSGRLSSRNIIDITNHWNVKCKSWTQQRTATQRNDE